MRTISIFRLCASVFFLLYALLCAYVLNVHDQHPKYHHADFLYFMTATMLVSLFISFLFFNSYQND